MARRYMSKQQKGELVLEALLTGPSTLIDLQDLTGMDAARVRAGIEWCRDYAENEPVVYDHETKCYRIADRVEQVEEHGLRRARSLYKQALRLERIVTVAIRLFPGSNILRIMQRHMTRMREDVEELVV